MDGKRCIRGIVDEKLKRTELRLGRITDVFPGEDNTVRLVYVRRKKRTEKRKFIIITTIIPGGTKC